MMELESNKANMRVLFVIKMSPAKSDFLLEIIIGLRFKGVEGKNHDGTLFGDVYTALSTNK